MRLILGGVNGHYLRDIIEDASSKTEEVLAAVAYASDSALLFDWCWDNNISLKFYGRLDDGVAVTVPILHGFLKRKSPNYVCRLVQHHHAKIIWWRGVGVYIGSANLSGSAWYKNVEAGCFFPEDEITDEMAEDVSAAFATLEMSSTPLTDELLKEMEKRAAIIGKTKPNADGFWASPSFKKWPGLVHTGAKKATDKRRQTFLEEWHSTLQELRNIGARVSLPENRPKWISESAPAGAQADQFLHAHYYQRTFDGRKAQYAKYFEDNKSRREDALNDAVAWWGRLIKAPNHEDEMLNKTAPFLREALSEGSLEQLDEETLCAICMGVHSIKDYARRVPNMAVSLPENGTRYSIPQKVSALSNRMWHAKSADGKRITETLSVMLYGGTNEQLPERIWRAVVDPNWKIEGLGISALGEIVGWALPDKFPPRNGRTSKALKSLGYDVTIHVE
jgi:hypothetical protein